MEMEIFPEEPGFAQPAQSQFTRGCGAGLPAGRGDVPVALLVRLQRWIRTRPLAKREGQSQSICTNYGTNPFPPNCHGIKRLDDLPTTVPGAQATGLPSPALRQNSNQPRPPALTQAYLTGSPQGNHRASPTAAKNNTEEIDAALQGNHRASPAPTKIMLRLPTGTTGHRQRQTPSGVLG